MSHPTLAHSSKGPVPAVHHLQQQPSHPQPHLPSSSSSMTLQLPVAAADTRLPQSNSAPLSIRKLMTSTADSVVRAVGDMESGVLKITRGDDESDSDDEQQHSTPTQNNPHKRHNAQHSSHINTVNGSSSTTAADDVTLEAADPVYARRSAVVDDWKLTTQDYDDRDDLAFDVAIETNSSNCFSFTISVIKFTMTVFIAMCTALAMWGVRLLIDVIVTHKNQYTLSLIRGNNIAAAFFALLFISIALCAAGSTIIAYLAPNVSVCAQQQQQQQQRTAADAATARLPVTAALIMI